MKESVRRNSKKALSVLLAVMMLLSFVSSFAANITTVRAEEGEEAVEVVGESEAEEQYDPVIEDAIYTGIAASTNEEVKAGETPKLNWGEDNISVGHGIYYDWAVKWNTVAVENESHYSSTRLVLHPSEYKKIGANLGIKISVRKLTEGDDDDGSMIPAGAFEIKLPQHIFYGWEDGEVLSDSVSFHGKPVDDYGFQRIGTQQTGNNPFYYYLEDEWIVIKNWAPIASATLDAQIDYQANPLKINGGHPASDDHLKHHWMFQESGWWNYWSDYYQRNVPFHFSLNVNEDSEGNRDETGNLGVAVMTRIASSYIARPEPVGKEESGVFISWDKAWGDPIPEDDKYFYVVWDLNYGRGFSHWHPTYDTYTHYYAWSQGWRADISVDESQCTITVGDQVFQGEYVSTLRHLSMAGQALAYYNNNKFVSITGSDYKSLKGLANGQTGSSTIRSTYFRNVRSNGNLASTWSEERPSAYNGGTFYAILIKYPKDAIAAAGWKTMMEDGLKVGACIKIKETWDSGWWSEDVCKPTTVFTLQPEGGDGIFSKTVGHIAYRTNGGGQTDIINNENTDLNYSVRSNQDYHASWHMSLTSYSKTIEDKVLGTHTVLTDTSDSTLMVNSSETTGRMSWNPGDKVFFDENDYQFNGFWFESIKEWDASYIGQTDEDGNTVYTWVANNAWETGYSNLHPYYIYVRYRNKPAFETDPYCVCYPTSEATVKVYKFAGWDADEKPINGDQIPLAYGHYAFPSEEGKEVVQFRCEHDSEFYKQFIDLRVGVKIISNEHTRSIVQEHLNKNADTYIKNVTQFDIYPLHTDGLSEDQVEAMHQTGNNIGGNADYDTFILTNLHNTLSVSKSSYVPDDTTPEQQAATQQEHEIAIVELTASCTTDLIGATVNDTHKEDPYKLLKGTFYELLPEGCTVQPGSIIGIYEADYWHRNMTASLENYKIISAWGKGTTHDNKYRLNEDSVNGFTYTTYTDSATNQTMLVINYQIVDPGFGDNYYLDTSWDNSIRFFFIMQNPLNNIELKGTDTPNAMGFVNRLEGARTTPDSGQKLGSSNLGDKKVAFTEIAEENEQAIFTLHTIKWRAVTTTITGFTKMVAPMDETLYSLGLSLNFKSSARVSLNSEYVYRMRYRSESGTKADNIILYDIIESGTEIKQSASWRGTFLYMDLDNIKSIENVMSDTGAKCAPEVYYSTTLTHIIATNGEYADFYDLEGGYWVKASEYTGSLDDVTAVAVDCRKDTDGENFVVGPDSYMYFEMHMRAPEEFAEGAVVNGAVVAARPFSDTPSPGTKAAGGLRVDDIRRLPHDAQVTLMDTKIGITKESDPDGSDAKNHCVVDSDGTGTIVYRVTVKNTGEVDVHNVKVRDEIPAGLTVTKVEVGLNGDEPKNIDEIMDGFSYTLTGREYVFTIDYLHPYTESDPRETVFYFYTTVDKLTKVEHREYENTAYLFEANGKEMDLKTDTMYHQAETTQIPIVKEWDDDGDRDGLRPETINTSITGTVTIDGAEQEVFNSGTIVLKESEGWKYTSEVLPLYYVVTDEADFENPNKWYKITYTVAEQTVPEYETTVDGYTIINKHVPYTTEIEVYKEWQDSDDIDAIRPEFIKVNLLADGKVVQTVEVKPDPQTGDWYYKFENLPLNKPKGHPIVYTVTEEPVGDDYETEIVKQEDGSFLIINKHTPYTTEIEVYKEWQDSDDIDAIRPEFIKINLLADDKIIDTVEVKPDKDGKWYYKFENLPLNKPKGQAIVYTVTEEPVGDDYETEIVKQEDGSFLIVNKHTPYTTEIEVYKEWQDEDDYDGLRPDYIVVNLLADGKIVDTVEVKPDKDGKWYYKFEDLPLNKPKGQAIVYTVTEEPVGDDYETEIIKQEDGSFLIINKHTPVPVEFEIRKIWQDNDDAEFKRPASITVNVLADGETIQTITIKSDENGDWYYKVEGLPRYKDGVEITYTITEETVQEYTSEITGEQIKGFDIYNTYAPETGDLSNLAIWSGLTMLSAMGSLLAVAVYLKKEEE